MGGIETDVDINGSFMESCSVPEDMLTASELAATPISEWDNLIQNRCAPANPEEFESNLRNMIDPPDGEYNNQRLEVHVHNLVSEAAQAYRQDQRLDEGEEPNAVDMPRRFEGYGVLEEFHAQYGDRIKNDIAEAVEGGASMGDARNAAKDAMLPELQGIQGYALDRIDAVMDEINNPTPEMEPPAPAHTDPGPGAEPVTQEI